MKNLFRNVDYSLGVAVLMLMAFGVVMVYSSSSAWAVIEDGFAPNHYFIRQLIFSLTALPLGLVAMLLPYPVYKKWIKPIVFLSFIMLVLLDVIGQTRNNAQSWFALGPFNVQPAEIVKIVLICYLASVFSNKQSVIDDFKKSVLPPLIVVMLYFILVCSQPDLGTAMILFLVAAIMVLCAGLRIRHLVFLGTIAVGLASVFLLWFLQDYQSDRFAAAYDPFSFAQGDGHQLINSYIAIASGGLTGRGLGESIEKTGFLPFPHTDFIIAIIGEELGLLGILFVVLCLAYLVLKGFVIGIRCKDVFGSLLAIGISSLIAIQTFVNLGAATGLIPITGVTLPFVSYGGSSLITMVFAVGILMNISAFVNRNRSSNRREREIEDATSVDS